MRKFLSFALSIVLAAAMLVAPVMTVSAADVKVIDIIHVNDTHSRVDSNDTQNGYAGIKAYYDFVKATNPATFLVDAGDTLHGQTIATLEEGQSIVELMNAVGFDALTPGNHDFNYGYEHLYALASELDAMLITCNVIGENGEPVFAPYVIVEKNGMKVAFIGVSTPETTYKTHPDNVKGLSFVDPASAVQKAVDDINAKGGADVVAVLSHLGIDEATLPAERSTALASVTGIDLIIDGHSHSKLDNGMPVAEGSTVLICSTGEYAKNIGHVTVTITNGVKAISAKLVAAADEKVIAAPDEAIVEMIKAIKDKQGVVLKEVVGTAPFDLVGERAVVRTGESNLSNLVAEANLYVTGADISISNGGNVRASVPAGPITKEDVLNVLPFGNYLVTKDMTGKAIWDIMEMGLGAYPEPIGGFPTIAGMRVVFDPSKEKGSRVVSIEVKGAPIDLAATYTVVTNDFLAAGGDGFVMYKDFAIKNEFGAMDEALIKYIQDGKEFPTADGRIKAVEQPAEEQPVDTPVVVEPVKEEPVVEQPVIEQPKPDLPVTVDAKYTVVEGDCLWKIALKFYGDAKAWEGIVKANNIKNPNLIYVGQVLVIPGK